MSWHSKSRQQKSQQHQTYKSLHQKSRKQELELDLELEPELDLDLDPEVTATEGTAGGWGDSIMAAGLTSAGGKGKM
jgi:hypothetical protein